MASKYFTTSQKAGIHETTMPLLDAMWIEFKEISKKKPDSAVSSNKVKIVNRLLVRIRDVLEMDAALAFLDVLDSDDVPQASDVTLMLSQYVATMVAFKERHYGWNGEERDWYIADGDDEEGDCVSDVDVD